MERRIPFEKDSFRVYYQERFYNRVYLLSIKKTLLVSLPESVFSRSRLYGFNLKKNDLISYIDNSRDYIISAGGIFILDCARNIVLGIDKLYADIDSDEEVSTNVSIYSIESEEYFEYLAKGELMYSKKAIINFYNEYEKFNGDWKKFK